MKLIRLFAVTAMLLPLTLSAQTADSKIPQKGNWMFELDMTPFGEERVFEFDRLQAKYFSGDRFALRLGLEINSQKNERKESDYREEDRYRSPYTQKSFLFGIHPGFEYRILPGSKVSPYVGLELSFRKQSANFNYTVIGEDYTSTIEVKNAWATLSSFNINVSAPLAFSSFGANMILGADFFFVKNMYFGFETGFGYHRVKYKRVEIVETLTQNGMASVSETETMAPSWKSSSLDFYSHGAIRFGVWF